MTALDGWSRLTFTVFAVLALAGCPEQTPEPPAQAPQPLQMLRWYTAIQNQRPPSGNLSLTGPDGPCSSDGFTPPPAPLPDPTRPPSHDVGVEQAQLQMLPSSICTLVTTVNQFAGTVPAGMDSFATDEFARLRALLSGDATAHMSGWILHVAAPPFSQNEIWMTIQTQTSTIYLAPQFLWELFVRLANNETPSPSYEYFFAQRMGVDPAVFDGRYDPSFQSHGESASDYAAVSGAWGDNGWANFRSAVDFVLAYAMASVYLQSPGSSPVDAWVAEAKRLTNQADGKIDLQPLQSILVSASKAWASVSRPLEEETWGLTSAADTDTLALLLESSR